MPDSQNSLQHMHTSDRLIDSEMFLLKDDNSGIKNFVEMEYESTPEKLKTNYRREK